MMSVEQLIDSEKIDESVDTATLYQIQAMLECILFELTQKQWGSVGQAFINHHQKLLERIQTMINLRHGSDGMTHLTS